MNAPPNIDPATTDSVGGVVHWLANDARDERFIDNIFAEMCVRLQAAGIPIKRASLHLMIHHPQWLGARMVWVDGTPGAEDCTTGLRCRGTIRIHQQSGQ